MRTRKELVEAYLFVTRRIISAMMSTNPDAVELPMRRSRYSVLGGTLLALLIFAGFWVIGIFIPAGNDNWKQEGHVVLNTDTGTVYVYMQETLYPVKNLASAKLIAADDEVTQVESADLDGVDRGWELGIADAPPAIPAPEDLVGLPWQVCSAPGAYDNTKRESHVIVSAPTTDAVFDMPSVIVKTSDDYYLLWNDEKHLVEDTRSLLSIGLAPKQAVPVSNAFINAIQSGSDLAPPTIKKSGKDAGEVGGDDAEYGDFFATGGQTYVLSTGGLAPVGETTIALLSEGDTVEPRTISASELEEIGTANLEPADFPQKIPALADVETDAVLCAVATDDEPISFAVYDEPPEAVTAPTVFSPVNEDDEVSTAEHFWIPGGKAALVREVGTTSAKDGTIYLLTDQGAKYALADDAVDRLGFSKVQPTPVLASLISLVPTGPALDPDAVRKQVPFEIE